MRLARDEIDHLLSLCIGAGFPKEPAVGTDPVLEAFVRREQSQRRDQESALQAILLLDVQAVELGGILHPNPVVDVFELDVGDPIRL